MKFRSLSKGGIVLLVFLFAITIFLNNIPAETETNLFVPNSPPRLIKEIPDFSWPENESLIDAFNLDDYFEDPEGYPLSYYNSSIDDIYVSIDPITHMVSFFPTPGFVGQKNVTFYASDISGYDGLSNVVTLSVGLDMEPPKWFFPSIDKTVIYQNDMVTFLTNWTDDRSLQKFIFSINQGAGWENYSEIEFSGSENTSSSKAQIRAPAHNVVYWRYYGFDTSGNMNVTDIQNFTVSPQKISPPSGGGGGGSGKGGSKTGASKLFDRIKVLQIRHIEDFQLGFYELRVPLKQGETKTRVLKVINVGLENITINISSPKLKDFTFFSSTEFSLLPGKSREITIDFHAPERAVPGQYFGYIELNSLNVSKSIPTVLDIQGINLEFELGLNTSDEYKIVKPGKEIKVNITLTNLKDLKDTDVSLYYAIKDYTGVVYNFSEEEASFFSSLVLERSLQVPETTPTGKYLFYARASNNKNVTIDSLEFEVGSKFNFSSFVKWGSIFLLIIIFAISLAVFMVKYRRDKEKERLLELYIMLNKLKKLIQENKEEEALELFIKIKKLYREPIPKEVFDDKDRLRKEISDLYSHFSKDSKRMGIQSEKPIIPPKFSTEQEKELQQKPILKKYISYIQEAREKGLSDAFIKKSLLSKKLPEKDINDSFNILDSQNKNKKTGAKKKE